RLSPHGLQPRPRAAPGAGRSLDSGLMALDPRRVAILGVGKIGESLLSGLLSAGWRAPAEIVASGRREERIAEIGERYGVATTLSNRQAVAGASLVRIPVQPQDLEGPPGRIRGL